MDSGQWCLFNPKTKTTYQGLTLNEMRAIIMTIGSQDRLFWSCWCEGWPQWQSILVVSELLEPIQRGLKAFPPPAPGQSRGQEVSFEEPTRTKEGLELVVEPGPVSQYEPQSLLQPEDSGVEFYDREYPRASRKFPVLISDGRNQFKTNTLNISLGGMLLADALPTWVVGYCRVRVFRPEKKDYIDLTCAVVENQNPKGRVRLQVVNEADSKEARILKGWLAA